MSSIPSFLLAFLTTSILVWLLRPIARFFDLVDKPGGRKKHAGDIPLVGGPAMFGGLLVGISSLGVEIPGLVALLSAAGLLLAVGIIDDRINLSALSRFAAQITAALIIALFGDASLWDLGTPFSDSAIYLDAWAVPFTVFAVVGVINAMNMSDGMDGIGGSLALVTLASLTVVGWFSGAGNELFLFICIISSIAAFLFFNLRTPWRDHASIFMGNSGSLLLGLLIAWSLVNLSQGVDRSISPVVALWFFALPLLDTVCIMLRRILKGRSPFAPDREHFHHILLVAGYSVKQAVGIMIAVACILAGIGLTGHFLGAPEQVMFYGFLTLFALYFWAMSHAWKVMKAIRHTSGGGAAQSVIRPIKSSEE